ncbi:hypothetical protein ScalyP_jg5670 [Parmales sp. scaly parma]|nr:hypothetical protein ScalyP_jg5670 [Parmales sp. scaly parma]
MKLFFVLLCVANAYSPISRTFIPSSPQTSPLFSTVAEPPTEAKEVVPQLTRFAAKKARLLRKTASSTPLLDESDSPFSYSEFAQAVETVDYNFNRDNVVMGTVVQFESGGALVDIGAKASAFLPVNEAGLLFNEKDIEKFVQLDDKMEFQIISEEDKDGQLQVSLRRILYKLAWTKVKDMETEDEIFNAEVISVNRGGAICMVEGLRAFLPGSHLTGMLPTEDLVGTSLPLKFLEVNQEGNKLVVSNRRAIVETQMKNLSKGDIISGQIKALKPYGAFVEVGGMSGLLHISQISYDRINDLEKVFSPGDKVKCMIIDHDKVNGRIALSTKTLEPEPGDMLKNSAKVFEMAEETAAKFHQRQEAERKAREEAASAIVNSLGDLGEDIVDPLEGVTDQLDSVLESEAKE